MDLMSWLPIALCFIGGVVFIAIEAVTPGFGLPGIAGSVLELAAVYQVWMNFGIGPALISAVVVLAVLGCAVTLSLRSIAKGKLSRSALVLNETESTENGFSTASDMQAFVGREGTASSMLRPAGIASFDGVRLDVTSEGDFIAAGTPVRITRAEGIKLFVKPIGK